MEKVYKNCQSCGMPLKKDEQGGGTNADGSKSTMYCSKCYQNGQFIQPNMTLPEMKELVQTKLHEMGFPKFIAKFFTSNLHTLERWKNTSAT